MEGLLISMRESGGADRVDVGSCGGRGCVLASARGDGAWREAVGGRIMRGRPSRQQRMIACCFA